MYTAQNLTRHLAMLLLALFVLAAATAQAGEDDAAMLAKRNQAAATKDAPFDPGAGVMTVEMGSVTVNGVQRDLYGDTRVHAGVFVPDGNGNYVWVGSGFEIPMPSEEHAAAREIRLQLREMAAQLFERGTEGLGGGVTMPASFVNQDNFESSSAFGRYIAEQMFYELNQLGVPVREYRSMARIMTRPEEGEFILTRSMEQASPIAVDGLALSGTYYFDKHNVFVNARLFRPLDGMVLRTANLVFPQTPVTRTMLAKGTGIRLQTTETEVKSLSSMKDEASLQFMLEQSDLH